MHLTILLAAVPLVMAAAPAPAAPPEPSAAALAGEVQRALEDPRNGEQMSVMIQSLTDAFLNLPVGELEAAAKGRSATAADKALTVRDIARRDDPQFEARLRRQIAGSAPAMRQGMKSLATALPALVKSFEEAGAAIERATANMPSPTYPRR